MDTKTYIEMMSDTPIDIKEISLSDESEVILDVTSIDSYSDLLSEMKASLNIDSSMINLIPLQEYQVDNNTKELLTETYSGLLKINGFTQEAELLSSGKLKKARDYLKIIAKSIEVYYKRALMYLVKVINKAIMSIKIFDSTRKDLLEKLEQIDSNNMTYSDISIDKEDKYMQILFSSLGEIAQSRMTKTMSLFVFKSDVSAFYDLEEYIPKNPNNEIYNGIDPMDTKYRIRYTIQNDLSLMFTATPVIKDNDAGEEKGISGVVSLRKDYEKYNKSIDRLSGLADNVVKVILEKDASKHKEYLDNTYNRMKDDIEHRTKAISDIKSAEKAVELKRTIVSIITIYIRNIILDSNRLPTAGRVARLIIDASKG